MMDHTDVSGNDDAEVIIQDPYDDDWGRADSREGKPLRHGGEMPGDKKFEKNIFDRILEMNNKAAKAEKIEYLKPTKAALFGLQVRF